MTAVIHCIALEDGTWFFTCDAWPAWRFKADSLDKAAAQRSLKRHMNRQIVFRFEGWDGRTYDQ